MTPPEFVRIDRAFRLTPSELREAIIVRNEYLLGKHKIDKADYNRILNELQVLACYLQQKDPRAKIPTGVLVAPKIWLPKELPSKLLREEFHVDPAIFSRVFYKALPNSLTIEGSLFRRLVYVDGYLLLNSLEVLMQLDNFEQAFLNVHRLRHGSLAFVTTFVPHYRVWYLDQKQSDAPRPGS